MDTCHVKLDHAQADGQQHKGHGNAHTLGTGVEELLHPIQEPAHRSAQTQGQNHFHNRLYHHGNYAHMTGRQRGGNAEGNAEQHQTHRVIDGNHQHQKPGQRAVSLILTDDHQGCGRSRRGSDGTQGDGAGDGNQAGEQQMQHDQGHIHEDRGDHRLQNADGNGLGTGLLQLAQTELVAHGKGDEAQCRLGHDLHGLHLVGVVKAQAGHLQRADAEGPQQQTCHQVSGDCGQIYQLGQPGHHQTANQCDGQRNQIYFHVDYLTFDIEFQLFNFVIIAPNQSDGKTHSCQNFRKNAEFFVHFIRILAFILHTSHKAVSFFFPAVPRKKDSSCFLCPKGV